MRAESNLAVNMMWDGMRICHWNGIHWIGLAILLYQRTKHAESGSNEILPSLRRCSARCPKVLLLARRNCSTNECLSSMIHRWNQVKMF